MSLRASTMVVMTFLGCLALTTATESIDDEGALAAAAESVDEEGACLLQLASPFGASGKGGRRRRKQRVDYVNLVDSEAAFGYMNSWPGSCRDPAPNRTAASDKFDLCADSGTKIPSAYSGLTNRPSSELGMTEAGKRRLEQGVARSLMTSEVVVETSREFGKRLFDFVVASGKAYNLLSWEEALTAAFTPECSVTNTGFAGNDPATIRQILTVHGNNREIWCYMYCLSKNEAWLNNVMSQTDEAFFVGLFGKKAGTSAWEVVSDRKVLVEEANLMPPEERYTFGTVDYLWPTQRNWVGLSFPAELPERVGGGLMWEGTRKWIECKETNWTTARPGIVPPLSDNEIKAECEGATPPCKLHWESGDSCFDVVQNTLYGNRTNLNGYRQVAGASGTTANAMQLALSLGFSSEDMLAFRTTMMAWLLLSLEHAFIEVMLAAQPFMTQSELSMQWGLTYTDVCPYADFQRIWPKGYTLQTSWGPVFTGAGDFMPNKELLAVSLSNAGTFS